MSEAVVSQIGDEAGVRVASPLMRGLASGRRPNNVTRLRRTLVLSDAIAVTLGWLGAPVFIYPALRGDMGAAATTVGAAALTIALMAAQKLYRARVCSVRAVEIHLLGRSVAGGALGAVLLARLAYIPIDLQVVVAGAASAFVTLVISRGAYRTRLANHRRSGRYARPVLLVGGNDDAQELLALTRDHPELGLHIVGLIATAAHAADVDVPWFGEHTHLDNALAASGASGVIIAANALPPVQLTDLARRLAARGTHVHLSSGLRGIATSRLRPLPLAHQPFFYVEHATTAAWQQAAKRAMDVALSAVALVAFLPALALAALAIKLEDRGPIFFCQERVGKNERSFRMFKLRTMRTDAERRRLQVAGHNRRESGPLFKAPDDPRVTKVGKLLRATSLDEVPQFVNVIQGTMSLVGPRPALPYEVAQFDEELRGRTEVRPGITGLWQTEARDNPSFGAYRRLDLHYVENWSVGLDVGIMLATVEEVVARAGRAVLAALQRQNGKHDRHVVVLD